MYKRLYTFITDNNILYEYQFGFRRNYSTTLALIDVIDNIYCSLDNDDTAVGIFLDLQKAFDTVKHDIMLYKMYNYDIRGVAYKWFVSYLSNGKQYTFMKDVITDTSDVHYGVPRGSVLGPLLFLI